MTQGERAQARPNPRFTGLPNTQKGSQLNRLHSSPGIRTSRPRPLARITEQDYRRVIADLESALSLARKERDEAVSTLRAMGEECVIAGMPSGDRVVTLANLRSLIKQRGSALACLREVRGLIEPVSMPYDSNLVRQAIQLINARLGEK